MQYFQWLQGWTLRSVAINFVYLFDVIWIVDKNFFSAKQAPSDNVAVLFLQLDLKISIIEYIEFTALLNLHNHNNKSIMEKFYLNAYNYQNF